MTYKEEQTIIALRIAAEAVKERVSQKIKPNYSEARDDSYTEGQFLHGAAAYIIADQHFKGAKMLWPWNKTLFEIDPDPKKNIIKSMSLLIAEYERLEREENK